MDIIFLSQVENNFEAFKNRGKGWVEKGPKVSKNRNFYQKDFRDMVRSRISFSSIDRTPRFVPGGVVS